MLSRVLPACAVVAAFFVWTVAAFTQAQSQPYAVIPRDAVNYSGPGRDTDHDLEGAEIKIGVLAPLTGSHQNEGEALLEAARMAIDDEAASPLPRGRRLLIVPRDQSGPWGRAAGEIVHLVYEDKVIAILTSLDGAAAHMAEQVANKAALPIVTFATDATTTQINLPWIFRIGPTDTQQAYAFARDIYVARRLRQAVLISEIDHDGRVGGEEFLKAARAFDAPPVAQVAIDPAGLNLEPVINQIMTQKPEALVFWTGPEIATRLTTALRKAFPSAPLYVCREAALPAANTDQSNIWMAASRPAESRLREAFESRYRAQAGSDPPPAAAQAYDAVRILASALRRCGPNRARLRDALAALSGYAGVSGAITFDHAGNDVGDVTLVRLP